ncbi:MAG: hypothetical protein COX62_01715 [Deltaproteobacteria bacterium CG_4_10_14_0_2_um_filter_43_8]|nr:MAG: hypothetical protein COV43_08555 [Deltaproteobacteria bacterium CG11_big_fil_rev_8_21_14_0_20_42_23]PJA21663.1 MAG: hypothetical protein COX62_01715 [Deltaproteobacteria bacterium CG_4_10_14_0_2_um_filter_43_8]PJC64295.1 MAG: hypothetical protein CO021_04645 [Deltaproteobacteria bacterium CG_4_9_14_0_2_um_filter_42_21]
MATISVEKNKLIPIFISEELLETLPASSQTFLNELDTNQDNYLDASEQRDFLQKSLGNLKLSTPQLWMKKKISAAKLLTQLYQECKVFFEEDHFTTQDISFHLSWMENTQVLSLLVYSFSSSDAAALAPFLEHFPKQTASFIRNNINERGEQFATLTQSFAKISPHSTEKFLQTLGKTYDGAERAMTLVSRLTPKKCIELFSEMHPALNAQILFHLQHGDKKQQELARFLLDQTQWNRVLLQNEDDLGKAEEIAKKLLRIDSFLDLFFDVQDVKKNVSVLPTLHSAALSTLSSWKPKQNDEHMLILLNDAKFFPEFSGAEIAANEFTQDNSRIKIYVDRTVQLPPKEPTQKKSPSFFSDQFIAESILTEETYFDLKPEVQLGGTLAANSFGVLSFAINDDTGSSYLLFSDDVRTIEFELESGKALLFERGEHRPSLMIDFRNPEKSFGYDGPTYNIDQYAEDLKKLYYEMLSSIEDKSLRFRYTDFFKQAL